MITFVFSTIWDQEDSVAGGVALLCVLAHELFDHSLYW